MRITPQTIEPQNSNPLQKLKEGFEYAYQYLPIRSILSLLATASLVTTGYITLLPIFAVEILKGGADTLGSLSASGATGSILACIYLRGCLKNP